MNIIIMEMLTQPWHCCCCCCWGRTGWRAGSPRSPGETPAGSQRTAVAAGWSAGRRLGPQPAPRRRSPSGSRTDRGCAAQGRQSSNAHFNRPLVRHTHIRGDKRPIHTCILVDSLNKSHRKMNQYVGRMVAHVYIHR